MKKSDKDRFQDKWELNKNTGCWEITGWIDENGYGRASVNKKYFGSHRVSWVLNNGEIPNGMYVLHKCDNRKCVNPDHLFLGTHQDNMDDMNKKGRYCTLVGESARNVILTEEEVNQIRLKYIPYKYTQQMLADEFGVCAPLIHRIIKRDVWKHI